MGKFGHCFPRPSLVKIFDRSDQNHFNSIFSSMFPSRAINEDGNGDLSSGVDPWVAADQWMVELDRWTREIGEEGNVFGRFLRELLQVLNACGGCVKVFHGEQQAVVARVGHSQPPDSDFNRTVGTSSRAEASVHWIYPSDSNRAESVDGDSLLAVQRIDQDVQLVVSIRFNNRLDLATRAHFEQVVAAALDIITPPALRRFRSESNHRLVTSEFQEQLVELAFQGDSLSDTISMIGERIGQQNRYDRVAILQVVSGKCVLVSTSSLATIDRRARQVRLLEALATQCVVEKSSVSSQTEPSDEIAVLLQQYKEDSGSTDIRIDLLSSPSNDRELLAAVVSERFTEQQKASRSDGEVASVTSASAHSLAIAFARHKNSGARSLSGIMGSGGHWRRRAVTLILACALVLLALLPVELRVQSTGRLLPKVRQKVFAPVDGIVASVHAVNGQPVAKGDLLVAIQSPTLDLARQEVLSDIATAKVQLASLLSARTRSSSGVVRNSDSASSLAGDLAATEETLKAQLAGLEDQLKLIEGQIASLQLVSPFDGIALRWDMNQTLHQRPVAAGQFLLDVIALDQQWIVELDVPDAEIGYVQNAFSQNAVNCNFRFRSNPSFAYAGRVASIDSVSQVDARGESIVRVVIPFADTKDSLSSGSLNGISRVNAGVLASLECGKHPLIVVYTRGLVRWARFHLGW
jgi:multidrug efflux pump subunit AcrA (membrane-fusion protein)